MNSAKEQLGVQLKSESNQKENINKDYSNENTPKYYFYKKLPFTLVKQRKDKKWQIIVGDQIVTNKEFRTKLGARLYIATKPWDLIVITTIEVMNNIPKRNLNNKKQENDN